MTVESSGPGPSDPHAYSIDDIGDIVMILDADGTLRYTNRAASVVLGYEPEAFRTDLARLIHPDDVLAVRREIARLVAEPGSKRSFELRVRHSDGRWRYLQAFGSNVVDVSQINGIVLHSHDVTDLHDADDRLDFERLHDRLTGRPARALVTQFLERSLRRAARRGTHVAVFALN